MKKRGAKDAKCKKDRQGEVEEEEVVKSTRDEQEAEAGVLKMQFLDC